MEKTSVRAIGSVGAALLVPPAIMSCFLPSPSTAYDKASGKISSGPASMMLLRRGEVIGSAVAIGVAAALALVAVDELGPHAAWVFVGAVGILALFIMEFERAFRLGKRDAGDGE
jgi:hypothetical protein